ncbi:hypothetical protein [Bradyrhizobium sp. LHD-71]|nr:hypothetical protein [Bradyrhizobium sp. LHD-71]MDQ8728181.1 hypothetical protein [Bradyrhizobium sp. LHD-71]
MSFDDQEVVINERHYRNMLCGRIHTRQDESVSTAAGRAALQP